MAKKISGELTFTASPAAVYAMVTDQAYVQEKNERTGGQNVVSEVSASDNGCQIHVTRDLPAEIPSYAKKFVGEKISTDQTDKWTVGADGSYTATFDVDFGKAPMVIKGTMSIIGDDSRTVLKVEGEVKASVPLVGGKLEGLGAEQFERAVRNEQQIAQEWLDR